MKILTRSFIGLVVFLWSLGVRELAASQPGLIAFNSPTNTSEVYVPDPIVFVHGVASNIQTYSKAFPVVHRIGETKEGMVAYYAAAEKMGLHGRCRGFIPANQPSWDETQCDKPTVRHDCFTVEQLFIVPWGWKGNAVGLEDPNSHPLHPGWRGIPFVISESGIGSNIMVEDSDRIVTFTWNGEFVREKPSVLTEIGERVCPNVSLGSIHGLKLFKADNWVWLKNSSGDVICKVYAPTTVSFNMIAWDGDPPDGEGRFSGKPRSTFLTDCSGFLFPLPTEAGIQILYYHLVSK